MAHPSTVQGPAGIQQSSGAVACPYLAPLVWGTAGGPSVWPENPGGAGYPPVAGLLHGRPSCSAATVPSRRCNSSSNSSNSILKQHQQQMEQLQAVAAVTMLEGAVSHTDLLYHCVLCRCLASLWASGAQGRRMQPPPALRRPTAFTASPARPTSRALTQHIKQGPSSRCAGHHPSHCIPRCGHAATCDILQMVLVGSMECTCCLVVCPVLRLASVPEVSLDSTHLRAPAAASHGCRQ